LASVSWIGLSKVGMTVTWDATWICSQASSRWQALQIGWSNLQTCSRYSFGTR
jgi:hypothetical protein